MTTRPFSGILIWDHRQLRATYLWRGPLCDSLVAMSFYDGVPLVCPLGGYANAGYVRRFGPDPDICTRFMYLDIINLSVQVSWNAFESKKSPTPGVFRSEFGGILLRCCSSIGARWPVGSLLLSLNSKSHTLQVLCN